MERQREDRDKWGEEKQVLTGCEGRRLSWLKGVGESR